MRAIAKTEMMLDRVHELLKESKTIRIVCLDAEHAESMRRRWREKFPQEAVPVFTILRSEQK